MGWMTTDDDIPEYAYEDIFGGEVESPKREPIVVEQAGEQPKWPLVTRGPMEMALLLHHRQGGHLQRDCPLCLIEFDRNGFQRRYISAVSEQERTEWQYRDLVTVLSYASIVDINTVMSYLAYDVLITIFAGTGEGGV